MSARETITKAIEVLEKYGWIQGCAGNTELGYCALGALWQASGGPSSVYEEISEEYNAAQTLLIKAIGVWGIIRWNDTPGRTKKQVIEAFRKAASYES